MCNFSKTVPKENIPEGVRWVACPSCKHRFEFAPVKPDVKSEEGSPWERRMELGLWKGIYQTFIAILFSPGSFFREMTTGKGIRESMAFGLLLGSIGYMIGFFWQFLLISGGMLNDSSFLSQIPIISQIPISWLFLIAMILSPVLVILNMFITGAIVHVMMLVFNGGKGKFEGTFKVIAFGQAAKALAFIPFIGEVIGWFWNLVIVVIGLKEIHKTSLSRTIAVVFVSIILMCLMLLPLYLLKSVFESFGLLQ